MINPYSKKIDFDKYFFKGIFKKDKIIFINFTNRISKIKIKSNIFYNPIRIL